MTSCFVLFYEIIPLTKDTHNQCKLSCIYTTIINLNLYIQSPQDDHISFKHVIICSLQISQDFLCSFPMIQSWITLLSTKHTNCKTNIWPRTCLSIHQTPNNRCIRNILHMFPFQLILWTLHETKFISFLYWNGRR